MKILALDLTSEFGSIAIQVDGELRAELALDSREGFAHLIFPVISDVLATAGVKVQEIECFAGASGPGAFTGVRVGLAAVKGLAEALKRPAAGVSNLRALSTFGSAERRGVVLDARRGDVFGGVYSGTLEPIGEARVMKLPTWIATLDEAQYEFIVQDRLLLAPALAGTRFENALVTTAPRRLAAAVARCAELDGQRGLWSDPAALDANYVRRSDAELTWKDSA